MPGRLEATDPRGWVNTAQSRLRHASYRVEGVCLEDLCFDAQQAAEKALKALLVHRRVHFPYVHRGALPFRVEGSHGCPVCRSS